MSSEPPAWVLSRRQAIGSRIRDARLHANLTQFALAERCGVDHRTIHHIEYGRSDPGLGLLLQIASAVGIPLAELVR
ncbi:transcriptional regulator with XRE-family HTH domain [Streptomyces sp. PvR006]|uniref:helix-turn-helix transcriptional regulator n=1 Tax=Streptomyces sp. PvR006 TaxID=2817860 RepID=UPI001AE40E50|nr:helix-turn-helix transcriptional regulator [Streptomyces sp. PvR006]MBP2583054.1 transcriptional regulator with XRE-family HTH domain [Streptomyces sp. PvR006]